MPVKLTRYRNSRARHYGDTPTGVTTFGDGFLANVCLQVAGGGYTEAQTRLAMSLQDSIRTTGKAIHKNVVIECDAFAPAEPNLAQMFDEAYEDQCRGACGL